MLKKFLKRFEKLENIPQDTLIRQGIKISKRFERLEIGQRQIEVAITDKIVQEEQAPDEVLYFIICSYCGAENVADAENCILCKHSLKDRLTEEFQKKARLLKKCKACGSANQSERRNCWVCGKDFFLKAGEEVKINTDNVITLNIDGIQYKSTDKNLPLDIRILMERIRRDGYKKELIDDWIKQRNISLERKKQETETRLTELRFSLTWRMIGLIIFLIFIMFQLRACFSYVNRWPGI